MSLYIIRFVLFINPRAIVFWLLLNVSSSLDIKNRNKISERGDPYRMPIGINIFFAFIALKYYFSGIPC